MPVYGYRCSRGHQLEITQRITDPSLTQCPDCGAPVTRVFYPVGIVFKGSGFYKTDSRGTSSSTVTSSDGSKGDASKADGSKGDGSKSDGSKSETKTESKPAKTEEKSSPKEGAA